MKPPSGPFWAWTDIGDGENWYLCAIAVDDGEPIIQYLTEDFEHSWDDDDWKTGDIVLIEAPEPKTNGNDA